MMCFMQIIAIFFHLNEIIVSVLFYANFIVSIFLIARNRSYLNYTSKIFLLNVFLIFLLFFYTILYNIFYEDMYDYMGRGGVFTITKYCYGIFAWFVLFNSHFQSLFNISGFSSAIVLMNKFN